MRKSTNPASSTPRKRSKSTPSSTINGIPGVCVKPNAKIPLSRTRKPMMRPTASRLVIMRVSPRAIMAMESPASPADDPAAANRCPWKKQRTTIAAPRSMAEPGPTPTVRSRVICRRQAFQFKKMGTATALTAITVHPSKTPPPFPRDTPSYSGSPPSAAPSTASPQSMVRTRVIPSIHSAAMVAMPIRSWLVVIGSPAKHRDERGHCRQSSRECDEGGYPAPIKLHGNPFNDTDCDSERKDAHERQDDLHRCEPAHGDGATQKQARPYSEIDRRAQGDADLD